MSDSGAQFTCSVSDSVGGITSRAAALTVIHRHRSGPRYAIFGAVPDADNADVKAKITGAGTISAANVDVYSVATPNATPTLATLQQYSAILVYDDFEFTDSTNLGNDLANYVDGGGDTRAGRRHVFLGTSGALPDAWPQRLPPFLPGPADFSLVDGTLYQNLPCPAEQCL